MNKKRILAFLLTLAAVCAFALCAEAAVAEYTVEFRGGAECANPGTHTVVVKADENTYVMPDFEDFFQPAESDYGKPYYFAAWSVADGSATTQLLQPGDTINVTENLYVSIKAYAPDDYYRVQWQKFNGEDYMVECFPKEDYPEGLSLTLPGSQEPLTLALMEGSSAGAFISSWDYSALYSKDDYLQGGSFAGNVGETISIEYDMKIHPVSTGAGALKDQTISVMRQGETLLDGDTCDIYLFDDVQKNYFYFNSTSDTFTVEVYDVTGNTGTKYITSDKSYASDTNEDERYLMFDQLYSYRANPQSGQVTLTCYATGELGRMVSPPVVLHLIIHDSGTLTIAFKDKQGGTVIEQQEYEAQWDTMYLRPYVEIQLPYTVDSFVMENYPLAEDTYLIGWGYNQISAVNAGNTPVPPGMVVTITQDSQIWPRTAIKSAFSGEISVTVDGKKIANRASLEFLPSTPEASKRFYFSNYTQPVVEVSDGSQVWVLGSDAVTDGYITLEELRKDSDSSTLRVAFYSVNPEGQRYAQIDKVPVTVNVMNYDKMVKFVDGAGEVVKQVGVTDDTYKLPYYLDDFTRQFDSAEDGKQQAGWLVNDVPYAFGNQFSLTAGETIIKANYVEVSDTKIQSVRYRNDKEGKYDSVLIADGSIISNSQIISSLNREGAFLVQKGNAGAFVEISIDGVVTGDIRLGAGPDGHEAFTIEQLVPDGQTGEMTVAIIPYMMSKADACVERFVFTLDVKEDAIIVTDMDSVKEAVDVYQTETYTVTAVVEGASAIQWYIDGNAQPYGDPEILSSSRRQAVTLNITPAVDDELWKLYSQHTLVLQASNTTDTAEDLKNSDCDYGSIESLNILPLPSSILSVVDSDGETIIATHDGVTISEIDEGSVSDEQIYTLDDDSDFYLKTAYTISIDDSQINAAITVDGYQVPFEDGDVTSVKFIAADELRNKISESIAERDEAFTEYGFLIAPKDEELNTGYNTAHLLLLRPTGDVTISFEDVGYRWYPSQVEYHVPDGKTFPVTMTLTDKNGTPVAGEYGGYVFNDEGVASTTFAFADGADGFRKTSLTLENIPLSYTLTVAIAEPDHAEYETYNVKVDANSAAAAQISFTDAEIIFTTEYENKGKYSYTFNTNVDGLAVPESIPGNETVTWDEIPYGTRAIIPDLSYERSEMDEDYNWTLTYWVDNVTGEKIKPGNVYTVVGNKSYTAEWRVNREVIVDLSVAGTDYYTGEETSQITNYNTVIYDSADMSRDIVLTPSMIGPEVPADEKVEWRWGYYTLGSYNYRDQITDHATNYIKGDSLTINAATMAPADCQDTYWVILVQAMDQYGYPYTEGQVLFLSFDESGMPTYLYTPVITLYKDGEVIGTYNDTASLEDMFKKTDNVKVKASLPGYTGDSMVWQWQMWNNGTTEDDAFFTFYNTEEVDLAEYFAAEKAAIGFNDSHINIQVNALEPSRLEFESANFTISETTVINHKLSYEYSMALSYYDGAASKPIEDNATVEVLSTANISFAASLIVLEGQDYPEGEHDFRWKAYGNTEQSMSKPHQEDGAQMALINLTSMEPNATIWYVEVYPMDAMDRQIGEKMSFTVEFTDISQVKLVMEYVPDGYTYGDGTQYEQLSNEIEGAVSAKDAFYAMYSDDSIVEPGYVPMWTAYLIDEGGGQSGFEIDSKNPDAEFNTSDAFITVQDILDAAGDATGTEWILTLSMKDADGGAYTAGPVLIASVRFSTSESSETPGVDPDNPGTEYTAMIRAYDKDGKEITNLATIAMSDEVVFKGELNPEYTGEGTVEWKWDFYTSDPEFYDNKNPEDPDDDREFLENLQLTYMMEKFPEAGGWTLSATPYVDGIVIAGDTPYIKIGSNIVYQLRLMSYVDGAASDLDPLFFPQVFNPIEEDYIVVWTEPAHANHGYYQWDVIGQNTGSAKTITGDRIGVSELIDIDPTETDWTVTVSEYDTSDAYITHEVLQTVTVEPYSIVATITAEDESGPIDDLSTYPFTKDSEVTFTANADIDTSELHEELMYTWNFYGKTTGVEATIAGNAKSIKFSEIYDYGNYETEWEIEMYVWADGVRVTTAARETIYVTVDGFQTGISYGSDKIDYIGTPNTAYDPVFNRNFGTSLHAHYAGTLPSDVTLIPRWTMQPVVSGEVQEAEYIVSMQYSWGDDANYADAWKNGDYWIAWSEWMSALPEGSEWADHDIWLVTLSAQTEAGVEYGDPSKYATELYIDISNPLFVKIYASAPNADDEEPYTFSFSGVTSDNYLYPGDFETVSFEPRCEGEYNGELVRWELIPRNDDGAGESIELTAANDGTWDSAGAIYWSDIVTEIETRVEDYENYDTWRLVLSAYEADGETVFEPEADIAYRASVDLIYTFEDDSYSDYMLKVTNADNKAISYNNGETYSIDSNGVTLMATMYESELDVTAATNFNWSVTPANVDNPGTEQEIIQTYEDAALAEIPSYMLTIPADFLAANSDITEWVISVNGTYIQADETVDCGFNLQMSTDTEFVYPESGQEYFIYKQLGDSLNITATALNATGYQWHKVIGGELVELENANGATLTIDALTEDDFATYTCLAYNADDESFRSGDVYVLRMAEIQLTMGSYVWGDSEEISVKAQELGIITATVVGGDGEPVTFEWDVYTGGEYDNDPNDVGETYDMAATHTAWGMTTYKVDVYCNELEQRASTTINITSDQGGEIVVEGGVTFEVNGTPYSHGGEVIAKPGESVAITAKGFGAAEGYPITFAVDGQPMDDDGNGTITLKYDANGMHTIQATAAKAMNYGTRSIDNGDGSYTSVLTLTVRDSNLVAADPSDPTDVNNTTQINVTGILDDNDERVYKHIYSIEITWGEMAFEYIRSDFTSKTWDAANHIWIYDGNAAPGEWKLATEAKLSDTAEWTSIFPNTDQSHVVAFNHSDLPIDVRIELADTKSHAVNIALEAVSGGVTATDSAQAFRQYTLGRGLESEKDATGSYKDGNGDYYKLNLYDASAATAAKVVLTGEPDDGVTNKDDVNNTTVLPTVLTTLKVIISKTAD